MTAGLKQGVGRQDGTSVGLVHCLEDRPLQQQSRAQIKLLRCTLYQENEQKMKRNHSKGTDDSRIPPKSLLVYYLSPPPKGRLYQERKCVVCTSLSFSARTVSESL